MGLLQKAVETYDAMAHRAGKIDKTEQEPLAPISHILTRAQIEITLDQDGRFITARTVGKDEEGAKIIIPATEKSIGSRSGSKPPPHPLTDKIKYLAPYDTHKHGEYVGLLREWATSEFTHPKLQAILKYIQGETILQDLKQDGVIQLEEDGKPTSKVGDCFVRWTVIGLGEEFSGPCWKDQALMDLYTRYYLATRKSGLPPMPCMISGIIEPPTEKHPKGIIPGRAALISSDDTRNFTFRGRFSSAWQAATISYTASQKLHNALTWLVANQGESFRGSERTFLCWNPQGIKMPRVTSSMGCKDGSKSRTANPSQYKKQLQEALRGWKENLPTNAGVVIAVFDTTVKGKGRLSVTYYNELLASDFLQRLHDWDDVCCWDNGFGKIRSPSLFTIISWAFGTLQGGKMKPDDRILGQQIQRLVACRVDRAPFPLDIERRLVERASNLQIYRRNRKSETKKLREELLSITCAAIRKYRFDNRKEEWDMALDPNNTNRSYLFGRLLAIADIVERMACDGEEHETNAMRFQKAFALRPMSGWRMLKEKLRPYYKRLKYGQQQYYQRLEQEIMDNLSASDSDLNKKLDDVYLLGYYHQRAYRKEKPAEQAAEE